MQLPPPPLLLMLPYPGLPCHHSNNIRPSKYSAEHTETNPDPAKPNGSPSSQWLNGANMGQMVSIAK